MGDLVSPVPILESIAQHMDCFLHSEHMKLEKKISTILRENGPFKMGNQSALGIKCHSLLQCIHTELYLP